MLKQHGKSVGELSTINFLQKVFNQAFLSVRPAWLKNPKTGYNLELDGYCEKLKIAVEYGSHNPAHHRSTFFSDQKYIKFKDNYKKDKCEELGIKLIQVPDLNFKSKKVQLEFKEIIIKEFKRLNIKTPQNFEKTNFIIVERLDAYTRDQIWKVVKDSPNRNHFERKHRGLWRAAERLGEIHAVVEYFRSISKKRTTISQIEIVLDAKKCKTRTEFSQKFAASYHKAITLSVLDAVCSHMKSNQVPHKFWEKNWKKKLKYCTTKKQVSKYPGFITMIENNNEAKSWYQTLKDLNKTKQYTFEFCLKDAKKHKTKNEWKKASGAYLASLKNGWHPDCTAHMINSSVVRSEAQKKN